MSERSGLVTLACASPSGRVVGWRDGSPVSQAAFVAAVDGWQAAFESRPERAWAVYVHDPLAFAAALLGAWHAGKDVVLPGDDRAATVEALKTMGCALAGDLPEGLSACQQGDARVRMPLQPDRLRLTVFTSGSQGHPEAIGKSLGQLLAEVEALELAFGAALAPSGGEVPAVWATVSHQHIYGLLFLVLWPLSFGRPVSCRRLLYPEDMAQHLGPAASVLVATPAHLKRLPAHLDWSAARQGLRAVFSSGGPLPLEAAQAAEQVLGHRPVEVFGSSETGGIAWRRSREADAPWRPLPGVRWRVDEGRLHVSSPHLPDDQWWITSDRAETVGEGFRLLGRADRVVKIEEKRVSLSAVEQALSAHPWVDDARVAVVDTLIGARVAAVVVPSAEGLRALGEGQQAVSRALRQALTDRLEAVALPRRWRFVDALPANAQGKVTEAALQALFEAPVQEGSSRAGARPEMPPVEWAERGADKAVAVLDIHAGLSVLEGHFPEAPILPGVAQLDWSIRLAQTCFELPGDFVRLEALKFVKPVMPPARLTLSLEHKTKPVAGGQEALLSFRLTSRDGGSGELVDHASGRAVWRSPVRGAADA